MSNEYNYKEFIETIANHYGADNEEEVSRWNARHGLSQERLGQ